MEALKIHVTPRDWQITEALVEILQDFDCNTEEARNRLQDALADFTAGREKPASAA